MQFMDFGLKGKRALVMAASRGLGYACARALAREGCDLVICSRDEAEIEAAAGADRDEHRRARARRRGRRQRRRRGAAARR